MKQSIFLDTCVISNLVELGISPKEFNDILNKKNLIPVISPYVTYELAKTLTSKNPTKTFDDFSFIKILNPECCYLSTELYMSEVKRIKDDTPVEYFSSDWRKTALLQEGDNLKDAKHKADAIGYIEERQHYFNISRATWYPIQYEKFKKYKQGFQRLLFEFLGDFKDNPDKIDYVRKLIQRATNEQGILSDKEVIKFYYNMSGYPALKSLLYSQLYLGFLTETNRQTPAKDRFFDASILIEASYCAYFLSADYDLIYKHAKHINPHINLIYLDEFLKQEKIKRQNVAEPS
ncbi:hypothetical protein [Rickettsiella endosymbiont of Dermanyssus gallinae]|uniref:hypothetical protein n=1 Tax=Rickettsiella endosymbiont of Dermanyssus gallinae TaxID=2856608 RepID=UPI001C52E272|nr:hypothetical protein [Rickettsiella endosymbiont of Dermanyssus gallinae]